MTIILFLLATFTAGAQTTPFTATGWVNGVPSPGVSCTNALGQVSMHGLVQTARVQAADPRVTGQVLIICEGTYNTNGTANMQGPCYLQIGTWDAAGTTFTPTGGLWVLTWHGVMRTDYSVQVDIAGYGAGGDIDGWLLEMTLTRATAADPIDPTVPYLYSGTIKPPPLNTIEVVNDFTQPFTYPQYGSGTCFNSNGQFYAVGDFPASTDSFDTYILGQQVDTPWSVADGTTWEWRVDLVSLDDNATNMAGLVVSPLPGPGYAFYKGRDFAFVLKWSKNYQVYSILWCDRCPNPLPNTNVVLTFALTWVDPNLVITTRVLDKTDPSKVLFAHSYLDTPASDTSLTGDEFQALTGMSISGLGPDAAEPPPTEVGTTVGLFQYTDGGQPTPTAIFENLEVRTSETPPVGIERAVRLSWPASTAINYTVEGGPTVQGPWLPVQDQTIPGFQTITVPADGAAQFYHLIQAP